jgi:cytosine/adenosine deaminase-related metal-dependent hydrolase
MFDLIVSGGEAVMPSGSAEPADIGVSSGKIAAIGGPGEPRGHRRGTGRSTRLGQIVIPGGVDPHIHCSSRIPFPGRSEVLLSARRNRSAAPVENSADKKQAESCLNAHLRAGCTWLNPPGAPSWSPRCFRAFVSNADCWSSSVTTFC